MFYKTTATKNVVKTHKRPIITSCTTRCVKCVKQQNNESSTFLITSTILQLTRITRRRDKSRLNYFESSHYPPVCYKSISRISMGKINHRLCFEFSVFECFTLEVPSLKIHLGTLFSRRGLRLRNVV